VARQHLREAAGVVSELAKLAPIERSSAEGEPLERAQVPCTCPRCASGARISRFSLGTSATRRARGTVIDEHLWADFAADSTGSNIAAKIPMMAMTTSSSIKVNACPRDFPPVIFMSFAPEMHS